jgi:hypothetical protein
MPLVVAVGAMHASAHKLSDTCLDRFFSCGFVARGKARRTPTRAQHLVKDTSFNLKVLTTVLRFQIDTRDSDKNQC